MRLWAIDAGAAGRKRDVRRERRAANSDIDRGERKERKQRGRELSHCY